MWTPPHFWALALFMKSDYHEAKVPMLTVTHGRAETRRQIWIYSLLLGARGAGLSPARRAGVSGGRVLVLNAIFLKRAWVVWRRDEATAEADGFAAEKRLFRFSLSYLFLHFGALMADALRLAGLGLPGSGPCRSRQPTLHTRRFGRNARRRAGLAGFAAIVFGLTVAKMSRRRVDGGLRSPAARAVTLDRRGMTVALSRTRRS
jgi:hypothetical protein